MVNGSISGRWVVQKDETVQAQIDEINKTISEHNGLIGTISGIIPGVNNCSQYVSDTYQHAGNAIKINDAGFNNNMAKIGTLASSIKDASAALDGVIGIIEEKISKLEQEKAQLNKNLYKKVWVPYR